MRDVGTDLSVAVGKEASTGRFRDSEALFLRTREKYPDTEIVTTGHSLGGGMAKA
jgi:putative lipase involved disintegration of autophagic bodies